MPGTPLLTVSPALHTLANYVYCGREQGHGTPLNQAASPKALTTILDIGLSDKPPPDHRLQNHAVGKYNSLWSFLNATTQALTEDIQYTILGDATDARTYGIGILELENVLARLFVLGSGHTAACGFTGGSQYGFYLNMEHAAKVAPKAANHFTLESPAFLSRLADFDTQVFQPWRQSGRQQIGTHNDPVGVYIKYATQGNVFGSVKSVSVVDTKYVYALQSSSQHQNPSRPQHPSSLPEGALLQTMQKLL